MPLSDTRDRYRGSSHNARAVHEAKCRHTSPRRGPGARGCRRWRGLRGARNRPIGRRNEPSQRLMPNPTRADSGLVMLLVGFDLS